jgi:hypothetical protein
MRMAEPRPELRGQMDLTHPLILVVTPHPLEAGILLGVRPISMLYNAMCCGKDTCLMDEPT